MKVHIGLSDAQKTQVGAILNQLLADEFVIYIKTLNFHWNVVGPDFYSLHIFLEKLSHVWMWDSQRAHTSIW